MRAWLMDSYDGVEKLRLDEVPDPQPGPGQAVIKTLYAALNPADAFLALAQYPAKPTLPHVLGRDGVGEVVALGEGVANVKPGDIVGILRGHTGVESWGTLAEKTAVDSANLIPLPQGWSQQELAGAPLVFLTAWQALTQWSEPEAPPACRLRRAHHGSLRRRGLRGRPAGQVDGPHRGRPVAQRAQGRATQTARRGLRLRSLRKKMCASSSSSAIAPKRVDIVVDTVAGPLFNEVIATLGYAGRISVVGRSGGAVPEFNTATLFFRRNRIGGVAVADFSVPHAQATWNEIVTRLDKLGKRPVVDGVFSFTDVKAAFARLSQGPMGKVLVKVAN